jgi:hypothetical protein
VYAISEIYNIRRVKVQGLITVSQLATI